eukprot:730591-Amphidinium_carterae.1
MAVEAAAAAEVRRLTQDERVRWEGKVFLPVLQGVGQVESVGGLETPFLSAILMEKADGTLHQKHFAGEALVRVAWALASTMVALNKAGFIHGDLKPCNSLWKNSSLAEGQDDIDADGGDDNE